MYERQLMNEPVFILVISIYVFFYLNFTLKYQKSSPDTLNEIKSSFSSNLLSLSFC